MVVPCVVLGLIQRMQDKSRTCAIDFLGDSVFPTQDRHCAEEKHQAMLVRLANPAQKTTVTKKSAAKTGTTR
jgi:hypothetical protein